MRIKYIEDRVRQMDWLKPSPHLRARVVSEIPIARGPITWSDRIWFSSRWRLSLVVAGLVLFSVQVWPGSTEPGRLAPSPPMLANAGVIEEAGLQAGLPAEVAAALARRVWILPPSAATDRSVWPDLHELSAPGDGR